MKKRFLSALLSLCMLLTLLPMGVAASQDDFVIDADGVLTQYNGAGGDVVIPDGVTQIGEKAFFECETLTSVIIPDGVTVIGDAAFSRCKKLASVTIPDGVTTVGEYAFEICSSLTDVAIPGSVTTIGFGAFMVCERLTSVTISEGVTSIGPCAFSSCGLTNLTIPGSVTTVGEYAFEICTALTSVDIQDGVTQIMEHAFESCRNLTSVTVPASVCDLQGEGSAFADCVKLTDIIVSEDNAFYQNVDGVLYSTDGKLIHYPAGREGSTYTIPDGISAIGECAFYESSLTHIDIPDSATRIGERAFLGCETLSDIVIPDRVTEIGEYAFWGCDSLTSVEIPEGVTVISESLFYQCGNLNCAVLPNSVTSIKSHTFGDCTALESVTILTRDALFDEPAGRKVFANCPKTMVVYGYEGSTTQTYCEENNITFVPLSEEPEHTHSYGEEWKTDEADHWHECECGDRADTAAHTEDEGTVTKEPTEGEMGVKTYACSVCGYTMRTESIPATGGSVLGGLTWSVDAAGKLILAGEFPDDGTIWVASWNSEGRFLSAQILTAQRMTVQLEPGWTSLKLMWLNDSFAPRCSAVTIEKEPSRDGSFSRLPKGGGCAIILAWKS